MSVVRSAILILSLSLSNLLSSLSSGSCFSVISLPILSLFLFKVLIAGLIQQQVIILIDDQE
jgi:hypothetical protein